MARDACRRAAVLGLLVGILAGPAGAQEDDEAAGTALADSVGVDETLRAGPGSPADDASGRRPRAVEAEGDSVSGPSPRSVLWRSILVPGWGQLATGHPVKALLFAGAAAGWGSAVAVEARRVDEAPTVEQRQDRAARRNTRILYYVLTATLAGLDAYVDRHLDDFDDLDLEPGALPGGAGARLSFRF